MTVHEFNEPRVVPEGDGGLRGLNEEEFWCDICDTEFESIEALIKHSHDVYADTPPGHYVSDQAFEAAGDRLVTDGAGVVHRAVCQDCGWDYEDPDLVDVSDELEDHARKEMHDVRFQRGGGGR